MIQHHISVVDPCKHYDRSSNLNLNSLQNLDSPPSLSPSGARIHPRGQARKPNCTKSGSCFRRESSQTPSLSQQVVSSTKVVLRARSIQPGPQTKHFQLKLYYTQAQSRQDPKSSTKVALQPSTIQPGPQTCHFQYYSCTATKHNASRTPNEAIPVLKLDYNQAQSSQDPKRGISSTKAVLQPSTIQPGP